ncbi:universal stress protein [Jeongeupia naejangsanensis]|uniref:Universal stress protein n=1 Tax=Jeongeupia naejangsanensis TaxID=613195 RepID=A0ABS2BHZ6_9NEIS|nr:universal stress protein [Jeongeupia naejangsanensis]MBM3114576.1 universal stress protein [Jeongeupia naejangsanensis]
MFTSILVDFDAVHLSDQAAGRVLELAKAAGASVTLLVIRAQLDNVMSKSEDDFITKVKAQIAPQFEPLKRQAEVLGVPLELAVTWGDETEQLLAQVQQGGYDLLVIGKQHTGGLIHAIEGVVWKTVVARAPFPVLVFP